MSEKAHQPSPTNIQAVHLVHSPVPQQHHDPATEYEVTDFRELGDDEVIVEDEGTLPSEIGRYVRSLNFPTNIDVLANMNALTEDITSLDVLGALSSSLTAEQIQNSLAGMCLMINRLLQENRMLMHDVQSLRANCACNAAVGPARLDALVFRKRNIVRQYLYPGDGGLPPADFNKLAENFDLGTTRRNEGTVNTLRRFVKYILENTIPKEMQMVFTVRERGGYEHLKELPQPLIEMIRDICLEAVGILDPVTVEERDRKEDVSDLVYKFAKNALQDMRRTPRKPKENVGRPPKPPSRSLQI
ncbi:hypothetical protein AAVH_11002 [Aphelenchoides avenae]|nr:hypothetical protein AAVH_11002 [Aphelenchus avenae]